MEPMLERRNVTGDATATVGAGDGSLEAALGITS
jgi:hypothetical protein